MTLSTPTISCMLLYLFKDTPMDMIVITPGVVLGVIVMVEESVGPIVML